MDKYEEIVSYILYIANAFMTKQNDSKLESSIAMMNLIKNNKTCEAVLRPMIPRIFAFCAENKDKILNSSDEIFNAKVELHDHEKDTFLYMINYGKTIWARFTEPEKKIIWTKIKSIAGKTTALMKTILVDL